jgi:putative transposase
MGGKQSNHTVYNVNYHFVWCPKYRHTILEPIDESPEASFRDVCNEYGYEILSLHISPDHVHLLLSAYRSTLRARLCERSRASRRGRCGNSTNRS